MLWCPKSTQVSSSSINWISGKWLRSGKQALGKGEIPAMSPVYQHTWIVFPIYMLVKEKDVEKSNVTLSIILYLLVRYHYCFMSGKITTLCRLATAY